ncbi:hypothetical protein FB451DRAFT_1570485 [Mycena latifolia]|nr:hypothetical protein FB451DRAFT_1570485 [Mycena latifolia]
MTSDSSARLSDTPLRRRLNILERAASRSFTTADSSTRNGDEETEPDEMQPPPSPPTSHEFVYEEEEAEEEAGEGEGSSGDELATGADAAAPASEHYELEMHPWYKPSYPVLLALAPPVGNWLTGGDHLKDALLLLLLVFYLHQLIEVPWRLYHAARPRLPSSPAAAGPPTHSAARAASSLRALELLLLLLCLAAPPLGALLLRAFLSPSSASASASTSASGSTQPQPEPLSWFSTTLFAFLTSLRPLRELITRVAARSSTLHALAHSHSSPSPSSQVDAEVEALRNRLARLEARVAAQDGALVTYVDDALAPVEKAVRRVERRVNKLRTRQAVPHLKTSTAGAAAGEKGKSANTVFVPAPPKPPGLLAGWAVSLSLALRDPEPDAAPRRRARADLEEGEGEHAAAASSSVQPSTYVYGTQPHALIYTSTLELLVMLVQRCVALAVWPLRVLLLPVRGVLRFVVGVGAR